MQLLPPSTLSAYKQGCRVGLASPTQQQEAQSSPATLGSQFCGDSKAESQGLQAQEVPDPWPPGPDQWYMFGTGSICYREEAVP